jgi:hypothetical protein
MTATIFAAGQSGDWFSGLAGPGTSIPIVSLLLGLIILFLGRRLFWLCVAAIGFAAGVELAPHLVHEPMPLLQLSIALVLGFIGALLATFLQKIAIAIAGFAAGGKLAVALAGAFALSTTSGGYWLIFLVGGVIGCFLLLALFDWALVFLSAIVGAYLILSPFALAPAGRAIIFVILVLAGVLAQASALRRRNPAASA